MQFRIVALLLVTVQPLIAQVPAPQTLKPANGKLADTTIGIPSPVRELSNGLVWFPNRKGEILADFATGNGAVMSEVAGGSVFPLAADSSLVTSPIGWIFLKGDKPVGMLPSSNPVVAAVEHFAGADTIGFVLAITGGQPGSDSAKVVRIARRDGSKQVLTKILQAPPTQGGPSAPFYTVNEQAVLASDGWVAILRASPYRVDWWAPSGDWIHGPPIVSTRTAMDDREKQAYVVRQGLMTYWPADSVAGIHNWPAWIEPFAADASPMATPDGKLLVHRTATADIPGNLYDVIDRSGNLERQILLGINERILGFGPHSVYVRFRATQRSAHVERHPWP